MSDADDVVPQSQEEVEVFIDAVVSSLYTSQCYKCTANVKHRTRSVHRSKSTARLVAWPVKCLVEPDLLPYWKARSSLTMHKDLLLYNHCIVVPVATLDRVHEGHQGIECCHS